jgi:hypothetical protein
MYYGWCLPDMHACMHEALEIEQPCMLTGRRAHIIEDGSVCRCWCIEHSSPDARQAWRLPTAGLRGKNAGWCLVGW